MTGPVSCSASTGRFGGIGGVSKRIRIEKTQKKRHSQEFKDDLHENDEYSTNAYDKPGGHVRLGIHPLFCALSPSPTTP